ncbi:MAG: DUF4388 domain-containing protein [Thermoanaerobaculia bacterium]|nr:DUF4388 domain-containing protein [Thermoanaerobaculia bacterium]
MSLTGLLEEVTLPEVLQLLSSLKASGKLSLTRSDRQGLLVVREGRIIYAVSSSVRDTLGSILVARGLVTSDVLRKALALQHEASREVRLGSVLIGIGAIDEKVLREAVTWQIEQIISELISWERGFFKFEGVEISSHGEIEVDVEDFLVPEGITTDRLLLDTRAGALFDGDPIGAGATSASLGRMLNEVQPPELTGELLSEIVSVGCGTVERGILFTAHQGLLKTRAHFGVKEPRRLSTLSLPLSGNSFIARIAERNEIYCGVPPEIRENDAILAALGDPQPNQILIIPMTIGRQVQAVFYGDDGGTDRVMESSQRLELLLLHTQIEMEQNLLSRRKAHLEEKVGRRSGIHRVVKRSEL